MRLQDGMGAMPARSAWRFFPWFLALGMSVVIAVNIGMAYTALHTFPGIAGSDGFDLSNHYDKVIDRVAREAALGWTVAVSAETSGNPVIALTDRAGAPLTGAKLDAIAERPIGAPLTLTPRFVEISPGTYRAAEVLTAKGQWDLEITATVRGQTLVTTKRLVVR